MMPGGPFDMLSYKLAPVLRALGRHGLLGMLVLRGRSVVLRRGSVVLRRGCDVPRRGGVVLHMLLGLVVLRLVVHMVHHHGMRVMHGMLHIVHATVVVVPVAG